MANTPNNPAQSAKQAVAKDPATGKRGPSDEQLADAAGTAIGAAATPLAGAVAKTALKSKTGQRAIRGSKKGLNAALIVGVSVGLMIATMLAVVLVGAVTVIVGGDLAQDADSIHAVIADDEHASGLIGEYASAGAEFTVPWQLLAALADEQTNHGFDGDDTRQTHPVIEPPIQDGTWHGLYLIDEGSLDPDLSNNPADASTFVAELLDQYRRDNDFDEDKGFEEQHDVYVTALTALPVKGDDHRAQPADDAGGGDEATDDAGNTEQADSDRREWATRIYNQALRWMQDCGGTGSINPAATGSSTGTAGADGIADAIGEPLTDAQIAEVAANAGLSGDNIVIAIAVALGESGGYPLAHNTNASTGDNSYGLWQINMIGTMGPARRTQFGLTSNDELFDPATNARAMWAISSGGTNWQPWGAYTNGSYAQYLPRAEAAAAGAPPPGDPVAGPATGSLTTHSTSQSCSIGSSSSVVLGDVAFPLAPHAGVVQNPGMFNNGTADQGGHPYIAYDILTPPGVVVTAFTSGVVVTVTEDRCPGRMISVQSPTGAIVSYLHLAFDGHVQLGEQVEVGQQIAVIGPASAGCGIPHLHIDVATPTASGRRPGCSRLNCPESNQAHFQDIGPQLFETFNALPRQD